MGYAGVYYVNGAPAVRDTRYILAFLVSGDLVVGRRLYEDEMGFNRLSPQLFCVAARGARVVLAIALVSTAQLLDRGWFRSARLRKPRHNEPFWCAASAPIGGAFAGEMRAVVQPAWKHWVSNATGRRTTRAGADGASTIGCAAAQRER